MATFDDTETQKCIIIRANVKYVEDDRTQLMVYKGIDMAVMDVRGNVYEFLLDDKDVPELAFGSNDTANLADVVQSAIYNKLGKIDIEAAPAKRAMVDFELPLVGLRVRKIT